ncbi:PfkB family carbohydrate kinase [Pontibacter sp. G13]|uniref:PfkB family carbohydrate kinase n=1 Tax=Pontibacter sp. G13 TaxID=3074898 RepID=UPI00288BA564|nr:PfkB family carbohydrate kinase [Pontibacter sp. G13]WNJ15995.1 PfkB family carbohydrate kinase [Pontibacter sp. G13]
MKGLFIGLTTIDLQYVLPSFPATNSKHKTSQMQVDIGGPATNAAATFACLGGDSEVCTMVGDHAWTFFIQQEFRRYALRLWDLIPNESILPPLASVWTTADTGDRTIVVNQLASPQWSSSQLEELDWTGIEIVLVDGFHLEAAIPLAKIARQRGIPVVFDGGSWKPGLPELLPWVDMAICSADFKVPGSTSVFNGLRTFGIQSMAITQGSGPILLEILGKQHSIQVEKVPVVDTLGAGDVFHGAACMGWLKFGNWPKALKYASVIAGKSVQYVGAKTWIHE